MLQQRERASRHKRRLPVRFFADAGPPIQGFTGNISQSGLFITSRRGVPRGKQIRIEVSLPSSGVVSMTGKVVWLRRAHEGLGVQGLGGLGVQVLEVPPEWTSFVGDIEGAPRGATGEVATS